MKAYVFVILVTAFTVLSSVVYLFITGGTVAAVGVISTIAALVFMGTCDECYHASKKDDYYIAKKATWARWSKWLVN